MKWLKRNWLTIILIAIFIFGLGILLYPSLADYWNKFHQSRAIASYAESVANIDDEEYERLINEAVEYNKKLEKTGVLWEFNDAQRAEYNATLNVEENGIMSYIEIPEINCYLPIYHGTETRVLQVAVGHIEGSSFPVGGESTHCILSGHRGLPSAKLFTDLDKLVVGDTFLIRTLDETLTYEVDQIRIVLPYDLSALAIVPGQDYCTLVTCTPYGINTHRLLVRGHRIANEEEAVVIRVTADAMLIDEMVVAPIVAAPILVLLLIGLLTVTGKKNRQLRKKRKQERLEQKRLAKEAKLQKKQNSKKIRNG